MNFATIRRVYDQFLMSLSESDDHETSINLHEYLSQEAVLDALAEQLEDRYNPHMRQQVIEILSVIGTPQAIQLVETALDDINSYVRIAAIDVVCTYNARRLVPKLIGMLLGDRSSYVRKKVAIAFREFPDYSGTDAFDDPAAVQALLEALDADENSYVRYEAALSLGALRDPLACYGLGRALLEDENSYVRWACAKALGEMSTGDALPALFMGLLSENHHVRRASLRALADRPQATDRHLKHSLRHEQSWVRVIALVALYEITEAHVLPHDFGEVRGLWN